MKYEIRYYGGYRTDITTYHKEDSIHHLTEYKGSIERSSTYEPSEEYIARQLNQVEPQERKRKRLEIDLAAILTGPTSASNAERLAKACMGEDERGLVLALSEALNRYINHKE